MFWKKIGILAAACAAGLAVCGCDESATLGALEAEKTAAAASPRAAVTEEASAEQTADSPMPSVEVPTFEPAEFDVEVPTVVPVMTATPGPSETFRYESDTIEVRYYDMTEQKEASTTVPVEDVTDPQAVIAAVNSALPDLVGSGQLRIDAYNFSGGNLFVDFDPSIYELGLDSGSEHELLEAVADTYLTNVDGIRAVYYTVGGEPYMSEHTQLNANEAYKVLID